MLIEGNAKDELFLESLPILTHANEALSAKTGEAGVPNKGRVESNIKAWTYWRH